jgi:hypothetical protein
MVSGFLGIVILVILLVILCAFYFSRSAIVKRRLRKTPLRRISECRAGEVVRISGTIFPAGKTLVAPLSGRKCVYYHILVEKHVQRGKHSHWIDLIEEEKAGDVVIKDGDNYAIIKTEAVKSHIIPDQKYASGLFKDAGKELEAYLQQHGEDSTGFLGFNNTLRFKEGILEEGEQITVAGTATWKRRDEIRLQIPLYKVLVIGPDHDDQVYLTDDPDFKE